MFNVKASKLIYFITESLYLFTNLSLFPSPTSHLSILFLWIWLKKKKDSMWSESIFVFLCLAYFT